MRDANFICSELRNMENAPIYSVCYILDYINISANAWHLSLLVFPIGKFRGADFANSDIGYRDHLCRIIGSTISKICQNSNAISLIFDCGVEIKIDILEDTLSGEIITLSGPGNYFMSS